MGDFVDAPDDFDPDDLPDDVDAHTVQADSDVLPYLDTRTRADAAVQRAIEAYLRELERRAVAAWMAGFDALDVVTPDGQPPHAGEDYGDPAVPTLNAWTRPVDDVDAQAHYADRYRVRRYDLRDLTPDAAARVRRRDH